MSDLNYSSDFNHGRPWPAKFQIRSGDRQQKSSKVPRSGPRVAPRSLGVEAAGADRLHPRANAEGPQAGNQLLFAQSVQLCHQLLAKNSPKSPLAERGNLLGGLGVKGPQVPLEAVEKLLSWLQPRTVSSRHHEGDPELLCQHPEAVLLVRGSIVEQHNDLSVLVLAVQAQFVEDLVHEVLEKDSV